MMSFAVSVQQSFIAQHFLIGGDWGKENRPHSHHFKVEVIIKAKRLDRHNYVADIAVLQNKLKDVTFKFEDKLLNELDEFKDENPSIELFAKIIWDKVFCDMDTTNMLSSKIRLWEDDLSWASYESVF